MIFVLSSHQEKSHSQDDVDARLEAELKQKKLKLKLYRSLQQHSDRQKELSSPGKSLTSTESRDSPKGGKSKLAEVLMGQGGLVTSSARTAGSSTKGSAFEVEKPIVDHSSDTDSGELV